MASHISSIARSAAPKVSKAQFYASMLPGDWVFCEGNARVSKLIEDKTGSCLSHVFEVWTTDWAGQWLTLEATIDRGVHVGLAQDYVDGYDGPLMLARRPSISQAGVINGLRHGLSLLDDKYNFLTEVSFPAHKLCSLFPLLQPSQELYCSGLMYEVSVAEGAPIQNPGPILPTPEQAYTDSSVEAVCAYIRA